MTIPIAIIDYEMGNLRSVQKAIERTGGCAEIVRDAAAVQAAEKVILPGVGAFRDAMSALKRQDLIGPIRDHIAADRPFLGICLGLQLLFDVSFEDGEHEGLGIVSGEVHRFDLPPEYKIPHMGWNRVRPVRPSDLLHDCPPEPWFYFVHSYHVVPADEQWVAAMTDYGRDFVSMISRGQVAAVQFHPEKSQAVGLALLKRFVQGQAVVTAAD